MPTRAKATQNGISSVRSPGTCSRRVAANGKMPANSCRKLDGLLDPCSQRLDGVGSITAGEHQTPGRFRFTGASNSANSELHHSKSGAFFSKA